MYTMILLWPSSHFLAGSLTAMPRPAPSPWSPWVLILVRPGGSRGRGADRYRNDTAILRF